MHVILVIVEKAKKIRIITDGGYRIGAQIAIIVGIPAT